MIVPATKEHPAQVAHRVEDVVVGHWLQKDISGAITPEQKEQLLARCHKLLDAVKSAREEVNGAEAPRRLAGHAIFKYLVQSESQS